MLTDNADGLKCFSLVAAWFLRLAAAGRLARLRLRPRARLLAAVAHLDAVRLIGHVEHAVRDLLVDLTRCSGATTRW